MKKWECPKTIPYLPPEAGGPPAGSVVCWSPVGRQPGLHDHPAASGKYMERERKEKRNGRESRPYMYMRKGASGARRVKTGRHQNGWGVTGM